MREVVLLDERKYTLIIVCVKVSYVCCPCSVCCLPRTRGQIGPIRFHPSLASLYSRAGHASLGSNTPPCLKHLQEQGCT